MSPLPTPHEVDEHAAKQLHEATLTLQRAFAEGIGGVRDFPLALAAFKSLSEVLDQEQAVEVTLSMKERLHRLEQEEGQAPGAEDTAGEQGGGKHVAVFVDGSSNSYAALRWAVTHLVAGPQDRLFLVNVMPFEDFTADAERILQQAYDFAHNAGVKAAQLRPQALSAQASSRTNGVGEAIVRFASTHKIDTVVLGSRGMGSIKASLMGALGMGSVTDFCVRRLACPVLVVKEEEAEADARGEAATDDGTGAAA